MIGRLPAEKTETVQGHDRTGAFVAHDAEDEGEVAGEVEGDEYCDDGESENEVGAHDALCPAGELRDIRETVKVVVHEDDVGGVDGEG